MWVLCQAYLDFSSCGIVLGFCKSMHMQVNTYIHCIYIYICIYTVHTVNDESLALLKFGETI